MTGRERIRKAINHREPDRVPIDNGGVVSGMHEVAYQNLLNHLGMEDEITIYDPVQRLALVKDEVLDRLGVDTRYVFANPPSFWKWEEKEDGSWVDEFGTGYERSELYSDFIHPVLRNARLRELKAYRFPNPGDPARFSGLRERAKDLYEKTDYAIIGGNTPSLFYLAWVLRGMEQFLTDLTMNTGFANYLMDRIVDWDMAFLDEYLTEIGDYIEYQWIGDDWGIQHGPLISPGMFRHMVAPRFKRIVDLIKSKTKAKVIYHTCGATYWVMEDLIEMGIDIVQPLQANAAGNEDSARMKRDFGKRMVFHGNTNNQGVFHKTKEEVIADALYRMRHLAPGGGYIFSSGHNIQANMPPENIVALFDTAKKYGTYPIDTGRIEGELERLIKETPQIRLGVA
jgi:uroporphyrinogen decarboxylase